MLPFLLEKDEGSVANESREGERGANESAKSFVAPVVPWNFLLVLLSVSLSVSFAVCVALRSRFASRVFRFWKSWGTACRLRFVLGNAYSVRRCVVALRRPKSNSAYSVRRCVVKI